MAVAALFPGRFSPGKHKMKRSGPDETHVASARSARQICQTIGKADSASRYRKGGDFFHLTIITSFRIRRRPPKSRRDVEGVPQRRQPFDDPLLDTLGQTAGHRVHLSRDRHSEIVVDFRAGDDGPRRNATATVPIGENDIGVRHRHAAARKHGSEYHPGRPELDTVFTLGATTLCPAPSLDRYQSETLTRPVINGNVKDDGSAAFAIRRERQINRLARRIGTAQIDRTLRHFDRDLSHHFEIIVRSQGGRDRRFDQQAMTPANRVQWRAHRRQCLTEQRIRFKGFGKSLVKREINGVRENRQQLSFFGNLANSVI